MASFGDRLRARLDPPRTLSFTRTGGFFVLVTLGVGVAAINTGNNLLFLLLGMMLSVIVASGILSEAVLRRLEVRRELPDRLFGGRPALGALQLHNPTSWPSLSVELREADVECLVGPLAPGRLDTAATPWWKFWAADGNDDRRGVARSYFLRVEGGSTERLETAYEFPARGVYRSTKLRLVTRFPFHLFEKARDVSAEAHVEVYPEPRPATDWFAELRGGLGDVPVGEKGRGDEYFGLREYRPGEDRRMIHWKRSAARGELIVKEHEDETSRTLRLHLYNARCDVPRRRAEAAFETGLERLAGLIQTSATRGWAVGLRTLDRDLPPDQSTDVEVLLRALARTELREGHPDESFSPEPNDDCADILVALPQAAKRLGGDWDRLLPLESGSERSPDGRDHQSAEAQTDPPSRTGDAADAGRSPAARTETTEE